MSIFLDEIRELVRLQEISDEAGISVILTSLQKKIRPYLYKFQLPHQDHQEQFENFVLGLFVTKKKIWDKNFPPLTAFEYITLKSQGQPEYFLFLKDWSALKQLLEDEPLTNQRLSVEISQMSDYTGKILKGDFSQISPLHYGLKEWNIPLYLSKIDSQKTAEALSKLNLDLKINLKRKDVIIKIFEKIDRPLTKAQIVFALRKIFGLIPIKEKFPLDENFPASHSPDHLRRQEIYTKGLMFFEDLHPEEKKILFLRGHHREELKPFAKIKDNFSKGEESLRLVEKEIWKKVQKLDLNDEERLFFLEVILVELKKMEE